MPEMRIQRLDVMGFRGISQRRSLLFDGKSILLFGENGTGKSTFVDALEKAFTGEVSTLDHRAQGLSSQRYGPHIRSASQNPEIVVTFENQDSIAVGTVARGLSPATRKYLEAALQPVYILRRGQILTFMEAQPRNRYDLLRPYLSITEVEATELAFAKVDDQLQAERTRCQGLVISQLHDLARLTGLQPTTEVSENDVLMALAAKLEKAGRKPPSSIEDAPEVIRDLDADLAHFGDISKPTAISETITDLEELTNGLASLDVEAVASAIVQLREREAQETKVIFERVLEDGARWIQEERLTECPLCEQEMTRFPPAEVIRRARERVEQIKGILSLRQTARKEIGTLLRLIGECSRSADITRRQISKLSDPTRPSADALIEEIVAHLATFSRAVDRPAPEMELDGVRALAARLQRGGDLYQRVFEQIQELRKQLESLPSTAAAQRLLELRELLLRVQSTWNELGNSLAYFKRLGAITSLSGATRATLEQARKEVVGEIFEQISNDIDGIYQELHKHHQPIGGASATHRNIHLEVREAVQGSVTIKGDFYECVDIDPRAYYSDAHLDTLGLSIFLALRRWYRKQYPEFNLLILDDVLTSVDAGHAVRLAEVLLTEFSDFQILVTTHDRIWYEHLRDIQSRCGVAQNFLNKVVHSWSIDQGPDLREPADEFVRLKEILDGGQPYETACLAGRLLEHVLQEMRYSLRLPVPAKPGELYEIGDLWPPFYREIKRNFTTLYAQAHDTLDSLDISWPLRNWVGAHFNSWALRVSSDLAKEFASAVMKLFELVYCSECRRFVAPSSAPLGQIACRCGHMVYSAPGKGASQPASREEIVARTAGALKDATLSTDLHLEWKKVERNRER